MTGQCNYCGGGKDVTTVSTVTQSQPTIDPAVIHPVAAIKASQLQLDGKRGRIYGPLDLAIEEGSLTLVTGRAGSGKTSLLLTLVGRMRPNRASDLTVLGRPLPGRARSVQRRSAAVGVHGLDDLDEEVTVAASIREREAWLAPWYRRVSNPNDAQVAAVCAPVFGDSPAPRARELVHELDEADNLLLRIALAMLSRPEILAVDDIDSLHDTDGRRRVWESLHAISATGVTVIVAAAAAGELSRLGWATLPTRIDLTNQR
jgi:ABC-type multidrug transport system ATPase subunit